VPFAHDEWPLRLPLWPAWFAAVDRLIYSTDEEAALVEGRFPAVAGRGVVIGQGFDPPPPGDADRFRTRHGIHRDILLYIGRLDRNKGVDALVAQHAAWRLTDATCPDLVLIGANVLGLTPRPGVHILGFVPDQVRADALAACRALINPSTLESFSLVLLEAWAAGRPTLVNAACPVLVGQSRRSGGGLWYHDPSELRAAWNAIRHTPPDAVAAGAWARERYAWHAVVQGYHKTIQGFHPG
jgi:glycosyltransferase involved in cell wall biosynthesis